MYSCIAHILSARQSSHASLEPGTHQKTSGHMCVTTAMYSRSDMPKSRRAFSAAITGCMYPWHLLLNIPVLSYMK